MEYHKEIDKVFDVVIKAEPTCPICGEPRSFSIWEDDEGRIVCRKHRGEAQEWSGEEKITI